MPETDEAVLLELARGKFPAGLSAERIDALYELASTHGLPGLVQETLEKQKILLPRWKEFAEQTELATKVQLQAAAEAATALSANNVDAIFVKGVLGVQTRHMLDAHLLIDLGRHPDPLVRNGNGTPRTLTVDQGLIDARPDLVARFLKRVVAAGKWAADHPDAAVAYIGRETDTSSEWVRYGYSSNVHQRLQTNLDEHAIAGLKSFKDFLFRHGFLAADFNVDDWIDPAPFAQLLR